MMCPSSLLLFPSLTSPHFDIRNTTGNPEPSSFSLFPFLLSRTSPSSFSIFPSVILTPRVHLMNPTHAEYTPFNHSSFEDPKVRLRHHSLMQDYQELHMDTEGMRKKLETLRERKATLMAEVRFLRRRYRHLRQDQPVTQPLCVKKVRGRSNGGKKSKTQIRVEVSPSNKRSEAESEHVSLPDLNHLGNETKTRPEKRVPLFDLNQISGEEEEETETMKNTEERTRMEESSSCKRMSSIELHEKKDMKLSSCRNGGNGSNKRKISWQDPVAPLRVKEYFSSSSSQRIL